jgi:pimeloyl-ACP methyl ester carboxylesterase
MSGAHAGDISAVAAFLKKEAPVPVWLVGTSMGTFSAAAGAIGAKDVDGVVLTSSITRAKPQWKIANSHKHGIASLPLQKVTMPALIVAHKDDGCDITPASDVPMLRKALANAKPVDAVVLSGGSPPQSDPCEAMSQHGFLGIERQAVDAVAKFILANAK